MIAHGSCTCSTVVRGRQVICTVGRGSDDDTVFEITCNMRVYDQGRLYPGELYTTY